MFAEILTFPTSVFIRGWHGYPGDFDTGRWKTALHSGRGTVAAMIVIQAVLIAVVVAFLIHRARRQSEPDARSGTPGG
jgi:hypothetical protein